MSEVKPKPMLLNPLECELIAGNYGVPLLRVPKKDKNTGEDSILIDAEQFGYIRGAFAIKNTEMIPADGVFRVSYRYVSALRDRSMIVYNGKREEVLWAMDACAKYEGCVVPAIHCPRWASQGLMRGVWNKKMSFQDALNTIGESKGLVDQSGVTADELVQRYKEIWDSDIKLYNGGNEELLSSANPEVHVYYVCRGDLMNG